MGGEHPARSKRFFVNDAPIKDVDAHAEVLSGLDKLVRQYPPVPDTFLKDEGSFGLFGGPCSVCYLFFRLSQPGSGYEDTLIAEKKCADWAQLYLSLSAELTERRGVALDIGNGKVNRACGPICETWAYHALSAVITKDQKHVDKLLSIVPDVLEKDGDITKDPEIGGWNEYLYGRAGYLYLLRLVRTYMPGSIPSSTFIQVIDVMMSEGPSTPTRWAWISYPSLYLGAGHGWVGIITQILLSDPSYAPAFTDLLNQILDWQLDDGNWPAKVPGTMAHKPEAIDYFIQWGHGAPGIVISLMSIQPFFANDDDLYSRITAAIAKAQAPIWEKGLLTKEPCLCHGAPGNALALTDPKQAGHFLANSTEGVVEEGLRDGSFEPSSFNSGVHRGLAGRIWAMYVREKGLGGQYLTYNDL